MNTQNSLLITSLMTMVASIGKVTCQTQCSNVTLKAKDGSQQFSSPNYPQNYPSNTNCQWFLTASHSTSVIVLDVTDFNLEEDLSCAQDYVTIYDGDSITSNVIRKLCGQVSSRLYISLGRYMTVVFHSNQAVTNKGFIFSYFALDTRNEYINGTLTADEAGTVILSPNYPNSYDSNLDYQMSITSSIPNNVIKLETIAFNVHTFSQCSDNYVSIYDGIILTSPRLALLCGQIPANRTYFSTGPYMTLIYHSNDSLSPKLYKFHLSSFNESAQCANVALTATTITQEFTSPNYPSNYSSNTDCVWYITASYGYVIYLSIEELKLEESLSSLCMCDYLAIYDGSSTYSSRIKFMCGTYSYTTSVESSGSSLTVKFHSDASNNYKGFRIGYYSKLGSTSSSDDDDDSSSSSSYSGIGYGGYTGIGIGTLFLISFLIAAFTCTRRYRLRTAVTARSNLTYTSNTTVIARQQPTTNSAPQVQQHNTTNITEINVAFISLSDVDTPLAPSVPRDSTLFTQAPMQPGTSTDYRCPEAPPRYSDIIKQ